MGFFNRKINLGRKHAPIGFSITFSQDRTTFKKKDVAYSPDLAKAMSISQQMTHLLAKGPRAPEVIAEELDAKPESVRRIARRNKRIFTTLKDGRLALLDQTHVNPGDDPRTVRGQYPDSPPDRRTDTAPL